MTAVITVMEPPDIFIPTKNSESTLRPCLESVIREFPESKIYIIDDSDSEGCLHIAEAYGVLAVNGGGMNVGSARDLAIKYASTEYMIFVDSDVTLERGFGRIAGVEMKLGADFVNSYVMFGDTNNPTLMTVSEWTRKHGMGVNSFAGAIIRTELARQFRIPHMSAGEDGAFVKVLRRNGYSVRTSLGLIVSHPMTDREALKAYKWYGYSAGKYISVEKGVVRALKVARLGFRVGRVETVILQIRLSTAWIHGFIIRKLEIHFP